MPIKLPEDSWPAPLAHCAQVLVSSSDEFVTIGEITSEPINEFRGTRMLYGALVPSGEVDSVLKNVGGIGHGVFAQSQHQGASSSENQHLPDFWIPGPTGQQFEPLVHTWTNHDKIVLLPNNALLQHFKLIPRIAKNGNILWDDLNGPVYDVVRVTPLSHYTTENGCTPSRISIRKDYLEDYLSHKDCSAVATFYDERFSIDDPEVAALIGDKGTHFQQPGREMWFIKMNLDYANQISQVWACALMLTPTGNPISDPPEIELVWPDRQSTIKGEGMGAHFEVMERAYVRDQVLAEYEQRDEFEISPEHGYVSYGSRWAVSYCDRVGRDHIELELRKLYEGAPFHVIKHYNQFAVTSEIAEKDCKQSGDRHVGSRARDLIYAFLQLCATISELSDAAGLPYNQEEIGQFTTADVKYRGWWTITNFKPIGHTIPLNLSCAAFLNRCKEIAKLLENLRPAPLRNILVELGLKKDDIKEFRAIKLLATLSQLATISRKDGLDLLSDRDLVFAQWNAAAIVPDATPLFGLIALRNMDAHKTSSSWTAELADALKPFGIDQTQCAAGWGLALDRIYDTILASLSALNTLIDESWA
jgi:hypothetical protein